MHHKAGIIAEGLGGNQIQRALHPPDSTDLSSCDFWLFRLLKERLREQEFPTSSQITGAGTTIWDAVAFERLQSMLGKWIQ
jgi:hypothetical protein